MDTQYDAKWVAQYFDDYAEQEWDRLVKNPSRELQLAVHNHALRKFIQPGDRVLEIGAGPGRFTQTLVSIGATVTVADISQVQLDLNRRFAEEHSFRQGVAEWRQLDMCDMGCYEPNRFDSVVCIGGPFSYVLDRRDVAMQECLKVTKPGGVIVVGVMSLWGTVHEYLEGVLGYSPEDNAKIIETGDLTISNSKLASHFCHMFRSQELRSFLEFHGLRVEFMSASSSLSPVHKDLDVIRADEEKWAQLIDLEIQASQEPGCLDGGTHLIAVGRKAR